MKKFNLFVCFLAVFCFNSFSYAQEEMNIKGYLLKALPPQEGRKIVLETTTGLLTITDTPSNHKLIKKLIKSLDVGPSQVMIEARFVEVTVKDINEFGVEWYWYRAGKDGGKPLKSLSVGNAAQYVDPSNRTTSDGITWPWKDPEYGRPGECFPRTERGLDLFIGKTTFHGNYLRAHVHALEQQGKANTLSAPKITTLSGQMANIQVTRIFPYVSKVELENIGTAEFPIWRIKSTIDEKTIGITLEVTPHVATGSKYITLDLHPVVDVLLDQRSIKPAWEGLPGVPDEIGWPVVDTRSTQTSVIVRSGQTIVLGGLIKEDEITIKKKVPILGSIPLLGNMFKHDYVKKEKKNLLIFITATLVSAEGGEIK